MCTETCLLMRQLRSGMFFALKEVKIFMCVCLCGEKDWFLWHVGNYFSWVMKSRIFLYIPLLVVLQNFNKSQT